MKIEGRASTKSTTTIKHDTTGEEEVKEMKTEPRKTPIALRSNGYATMIKREKVKTGGKIVLIHQETQSKDTRMRKRRASQ